MKPCRKAPAGYRCRYPDGHLGLCALHEIEFWAMVNLGLIVFGVLIGLADFVLFLAWCGQQTP